MLGDAPPGERQRGPRPALWGGAALAVVLAAYQNVLDVGFVWDDHVLIEQNVELHLLRAPWEYLARSFWQHPFHSGAGQAFYRPLVSLSFALDWALGRSAPDVFHLTNLAAHLAVVGLVFAHARRRGAAGPTAAAGAALFGVMPRLTESVTWISGRTDVLATLFSLLAWWWAEGPGTSRRALAVVSLWLALLSKEVALVAALALALERALALRAGSTRPRQEAALLVGAALAVAGWAALRAHVGGQAPPRWREVPTALAALGEGAWCVLTPWRPNAQIGFALEPEGWAIALGAATLLGALAAGAALLRSRSPWRAAWLAGAVGAVALVCVVALDSYTLFSDRFLYLPLALGAVVAAARPWPRWALVLAAGGVLAGAVGTSARNAVWAEPLRFWSETYHAASPRNPGAAEGLADALADVSRFEEARHFYLRAEAVRDAPEPRTRLSLAVMDSRLGRDQAALEGLEALLAARPDWKKARYDLVLFRARAGDFGGARAALEAARREFGEDPVLTALAADLEAAQRGAASPSALERARALHALGAIARAEGLYLELLDSTGAGLEAAQWLLSFGSEASARRALERLASEPDAQVRWAARFAVQP